MQHRRKRGERVCRDQGGALAVTSALTRVHHPLGQAADRRVGELAEHVVTVGARDCSPYPNASAVQRMPPVVDRLPNRYLGTM